MGRVPEEKIVFYLDGDTIINHEPDYHAHNQKVHEVMSNHRDRDMHHYNNHPFHITAGGNIRAFQGGESKVVYEKDDGDILVDAEAIIPYSWYAATEETKIII